MSGGERKRTSIGYELITEPSLLILDEPTSGLDASTALRIVKTLKNEAKRGMSVIATIHQPSAALFFLFDRVIVLSEGHCVFNGAPSEVKEYFGSFGLQMNRYSNPADKLSIIASEPKRALNSAITTIALVDHSRTKQRKNWCLDETEAENLYSQMNRRLSIIGETRGVSRWKQFKLILGRFLLQAWRQPLSVVALIFMGLWQALLQAAIFGGVGSPVPSPTNQAVDKSLLQNLLGLAFLVTTD